MSEPLTERDGYTIESVPAVEAAGELRHLWHPDQKFWEGVNETIQAGVVATDSLASYIMAARAGQEAPELPTVEPEVVKRGLNAWMDILTDSADLSDRLMGRLSGGQNDKLDWLRPHQKLVLLDAAQIVANEYASAFSSVQAVGLMALYAKLGGMFEATLRRELLPKWDILAQRIARAQREGDFGAYRVTRRELLAHIRTEVVLAKELLGQPGSKLGPGDFQTIMKMDELLRARDVKKDPETGEPPMVAAIEKTNDAMAVFNEEQEAAVLPIRQKRRAICAAARDNITRWGIPQDKDLERARKALMAAHSQNFQGIIRLGLSNKKQENSALTTRVVSFLWQLGETIRQTGLTPSALRELRDNLALAEAEEGYLEYANDRLAEQLRAEDEKVHDPTLAGTASLRQILAIVREPRMWGKLQDILYANASRGSFLKKGGLMAMRDVLIADGGPDTAIEYESEVGLSGTELRRRQELLYRVREKYEEATKIPLRFAMNELSEGAAGPAAKTRDTRVLTAPGKIRFTIEEERMAIVDALQTALGPYFGVEADIDSGRARLPIFAVIFGVRGGKLIPHEEAGPEDSVYFVLESVERNVATRVGIGKNWKDIISAPVNSVESKGGKRFYHMPEYTPESHLGRIATWMVGVGVPEYVAYGPSRALLLQAPEPEV